MTDPISDLSAGDNSPKLTRASIKDLTLIVNQISYTIKTPDTSVTPDALQISSDGNMSLGSVPDVASTHGKSFSVVNSESSGQTVTRIRAISANGNSVISAQSGPGMKDTGFTLADWTGAQIAKLRLDTTDYSLYFDSRNNGANYSAMRLKNTGEFFIGNVGDASTIGQLNITKGILSSGVQTVIAVSSDAPLTVPALISGADGGILQISAGSAQSSSARGAQIDLISGSNPGAGKLIFRSGTNSDGLSSPEVARLVPEGRLAIGLGGFDPEVSIHARSPNGQRGRILIDGINDYPGFTGRRSNGSWSNQTAVMSGDVLTFFNAHGNIGGANNYRAGPTITCSATENWSASGTGTAWSLSTIENGTVASNKLSMYWAHNGFVGINTSDPKVRFVVAGNNNDSFEVDTSAGGNFIQSYNRTSNEYSALGYKAFSHTWSRGTNGISTGMTLSSTGVLAINTTTTSGGNGNTLVDSRVIISDVGSATMLHLQNGTAYAGLKFKAGPLHQSSGGVNYYELTTRPGDIGTGVAEIPDQPLIRFEASISLNPRLILQPTGYNSQVVVGNPVNAPVSSRFAINNEADYNYPGLVIVGKDMSAVGVSPSADMVIQRKGAVSSNAGLMPWLQFETSDAAFTGNHSAAIGAAANSLQFWNYIAGVWTKNVSIDAHLVTMNTQALVNGGLTVRGPSTSSGNIVLQSNTALGVAHWISSKTSGFMHLGGNGSSEPSMGAIAIAGSNRSIGLYGQSEAYLGYTYGHSGTSTALHVSNNDTSVNAQAHVYLSSGQSNNAGSTIGAMSWVLPNISSTGNSRVVNIGGETDSNHTVQNPTGRFVISTKNTGDATATPRLRIRASGNATLGSALNDSARLYIYNEGRNVDGVRVDFTDTSATTSSFVSHRSDTVGYAMSFLVAGNFAGSITHPSITTTNYGTGSDRRIKKNIIDASSSDDIIRNIRVVSHDFVADDYHVPFAFVAQELYEVYPTAVVVGDTSAQIDANSKIWQVDNSKLVPLLIKQAQEAIVQRDLIRDELLSTRSELQRLQQLVEEFINKKS